MAASHHPASSSFLIGCVGKPSAGKSSFLNAATDAKAKVGSFPFTTIEPNTGIAYYQTPCPCRKYDKGDSCAPRYGYCRDGIRNVPVRILDVAGLVPGASEGRGRGNSFLDDLRHAQVLLHVIDVSGTTDEKGDPTQGYDPSRDVQWLQDEIHSWIFNNLNKKWPGVVRRHVMTKANAVTTLSNQLSGYGTRPRQVLQALEQLGNMDLTSWTEDTLREYVRLFLPVRFPMVLVLNKIDTPSADANISKICEMFPQMPTVMTSALTERFLRKLVKQHLIVYNGGCAVDTTETLSPEVARAAGLQPTDERVRMQLERVQDLVLYRYGGTGIQEAVQEAVRLLDVVPFYPVKNAHNYTDASGVGTFRDCMLVPRGTTMREAAGMINNEMAKHFIYAEGAGGRQHGEDAPITLDCNIARFVTAAAVPVASSSTGSATRE